jgi:hypothetical protein
MKTFIKILIMNCLLACGLVLAYSSGMVHEVWIADKSFLSWLIIAMMVYFSTSNLILSFGMKKKGSDFILWALDDSEWYTPKLAKIGFIGTLWGLIIMMKHIGGGDTESTIMGIKEGMGTAMYTTILGTVAGLLLSVQNRTIRRNVEARGR